MGLGLDEPAAFATMDEAAGLGITLFDTAGSYAGGASEIMIGRWLIERDSTVSGGIRLATKVAPPDVEGTGRRFDAAFLKEKFSGSLERLGVDAVEFLLTHAPDDSTPIEETLRGLRRSAPAGVVLTRAPATLTLPSSRPRSTRPNDSASLDTRSCRTATACCDPKTTGP